GMIGTVRERVARAIRQRKSLEQTLAGKPTAEFDAQYGGGFIKGDVFVSRMYAELARQRRR
ncbi:MAG: hypothetical protein RML32_04805, partial [Gammaproteobacteria bacterium]|nr:hypothetical protein [Gammaproteobacteria bacterium]